MHQVTDLIILFEHCFFTEFHTLLEGGAEEPQYIPASNGVPSRIIFTRDYFASALHEVAHWCVAGDRRRQLNDYGYWYAPDGRSQEQQEEFERVEAKPQALEWIFSRASGVKFRVSADNLTSGFGASWEFKANIAAQAQQYCVALPHRPARFVSALSHFFGTSDVLRSDLYVVDYLQ